MSHYPSREFDPALERSMLKDWLKMLDPFPQEAIEHACTSYMQAQPSRKPTPGDIRNRAETWVGERAARSRLAEMAKRQAKEEPRGDRVRPEVAKEILEEYGFTDGRLNGERLRLAKRFGSKSKLKPEQYLTPKEIKARNEQ